MEENQPTNSTPAINPTQDGTNNRTRSIVLIALILVISGLLGSIIFFDKIESIFKKNPSSTPKPQESAGVPPPKSDIVCKQFQDLTEALNDLGAACILDLSGKNLTTVPQDVLKLKNLNQIILNDNNFTQIPQELATLPNLYEVDITNNNLSAVPEYITSFTPLQRLDLSNNNITTLPDMQSLKNLNYLILRGNNIGENEKMRIKDMFVNREEPVIIEF